MGSAEHTRSRYTASDPHLDPLRRSSDRTPPSPRLARVKSPTDRASSRDPEPPLFTRYGFTRTGLPDAPLRIEPYPAIATHGALRATVVASAIDLVGGAGVDLRFDGWHVGSPCVAVAVAPDSSPPAW